MAKPFFCFGLFFSKPRENCRSFLTCLNVKIWKDKLCHRQNVSDKSIILNFVKKKKKVSPVILLQSLDSSIDKIISTAPNVSLNLFGFFFFIISIFVSPFSPLYLPLSLYLCLSISLVYNPHCFQTCESV